MAARVLTFVTMQEQDHRFLVKEMHDQIVFLERYHGFQIEDDALFLASWVAQNTENKSSSELHQRFFYILFKGYCLCYSSKRVCMYQNELDKRKYILRRALVEHAQLVKEKGSDFWLSQIEGSLKEAFYELVSFVKLRMQMGFDDFVDCARAAETIGDYSMILELIQAKDNWKFKEKNFLGVEEIAEVASDLTGIPVSWIRSRPEERFKRVQQRLKKRFIGRDDAIDEIFEALKSKAKKIFSWQRSFGLFLFAGPNCSGKAELAKAIADELYDNDDNDSRLAHFSMEIYSELNSLPHFVDSLSAVVKLRPYSVLLFDKIEMANSSVIHTLMGILKNSEAKGRAPTIDFTNTLVILTSDLEEKQVRGSLFKPEMLMMLDKLVVFDLAIPLLDTTRLLLRGWASDETKIRKKEVIVCPSSAALAHIAAGAARMFGEKGEGLKRWMNERVVFPVSSKMNVEDEGAAENLTVYLDIIQETEELSFNFQHH